MLTIDCPGVADCPQIPPTTQTPTPKDLCVGDGLVVAVWSLYLPDRNQEKKKYHLVVESFNMLSVQEKKLIIIIIVTIINEFEEESQAPATLNGWSL